MIKAVVIPGYNAADTLEATCDRLPDELWEDGSFAVIVNDASTDAMGEVAARLKRRRKQNIHVVTHEENRGLGGALKTGLRYGMENGAEVMPVVHSDGQYAPELVLDVCRPIEEGRALIVQGSRMRGGARGGENPMPLTRYIPNRLLTVFENLCVGTDLAEFHSGYMVFSKQLLEEAPFESLQNNYNFDAEMIILAHLLGHRCAEVPIPTCYDDDTSSLNPIPYGLNVLRMMVRHGAGHYRQMLDESTSTL